MFDKFGEFDSAEEINELAVNLRREGNKKSIYEVAKENGRQHLSSPLFTGKQTEA